MKLSLYLVFVLFGISVSAQTKINTHFILTGNVHGRDTGLISLRYTNSNGKWVMDTTYLHDGKFSFGGDINEPVLADIVGKRKIIDFEEANYVNIFLEPGVQHVELTENKYAEAVVTGSSSQKDLDLFNRKIDSIDNKYRSVLNQNLQIKYEYQRAKTDAERDLINEKSDGLQPQLESRAGEILHEDISFAVHHPDSYVSPFIFFIPANELPVDSAFAIFNSFTPRIQNSISGKAIRALLKKREQNSTGRMATSFKGLSIDGRTISLSQFRGKYVLLDFWASWCVPCLAQIPHLKVLFGKYHTRGLDILSISLDQDSIAWRNSVAKEGINIWGNMLVNRDLSEYYKNVTDPIPSQILIDPEGKIIWKSDDQNDNLTIGEVLSLIFKNK